MSFLSLTQRYGSTYLYEYPVLKQCLLIYRDVYGHRATNFAKSFEFYGPDVYGNPTGIVRADNESHAAQRRLVSHAFSDKALKEQESMIKGYASLMVERLREKAVQGAVNVVDWYNFATFDVSIIFPF